MEENEKEDEKQDICCCLGILNKKEEVSIDKKQRKF